VSSIPWLQLRVWKGSQQDAFEELCCQIAHTEPVPDGVAFQRKGRPDSGIECFWTLRDGREWGWQAKFFPDGLDDQRWAQCDDSVRKALEGHPNLTTLYFCLPHNFPDARLPGRRSAAERRTQHQTKWAAWAAARGRVVEFVLWGEHELTLRLSKAEHRGRWWFWFNAPALDSEWFERHVAATAALAAASDRYTSDFNVELSLAGRFEALGRTPQFSALLDSKGGKLREALEELGKSRTLSEKESVAAVTTSLTEALTIVQALPVDAAVPMDFAPLGGALTKVQARVSKVNAEFRQMRNERAAVFERQHGRRPEYGEIPDESVIHRSLDQIYDKITEVLNFCVSPDAQLANLPVLLLVGEAGNGKTQLACTVAEQRVINGMATILMLGEQFDESDPWACILRRHGLSCDRDEFLGALNAAGEAAGSRVLIIVDAINEGPGISFWNKHLASMLTHLRHFQYLAIAVTVRSAYETSLKGCDSENCVRVEHHGFAEQTNEAGKQFFARYGLAEPEVPLLNPEFNNPLLLKLLCRALQDNASLIAEETFGVTAVFALLLKSINRRLSDPTVLDYDEGENLVQRAVSDLAARMAVRGEEFLPLDEARVTLLRLYPSSSGHSRSLLYHLIAEHVVVRVPGPDIEGAEHEVLRFTYQRMSDHLIVQAVLAGISAEQLPDLFAADGVFGKRMPDGWTYDIIGWIEALAIQLPERYGLEIDEVLTESVDDEAIRYAFIKGLVWRKAGAFTDATWRRVENLLQPWDSIAFTVLDELIAVIARPGHPFNADWLDGLLKPLSMAERDAFWSIYLFGQVSEEHGIHRLIEWAWTERIEIPFSDDTVRLAATTLAWCLTTSDRFVRDRATKALVALLEQRVQVLTGLLDHFAHVAEPYVQERLCAVAYGCAMRTSQIAELQSLAQGVYNRVFRDENPPPSVLLRDHARGVVDCAVRRGAELEYEPSRIVPPFCSGWPKRPPSLDQLGRRYHIGDHDDPHGALRRIFHSVTADDFEHYIIRDVTNWSNRRKRGKKSRSPRQMFQELLRTMSEEDAKLLETYAKACRAIDGRQSDQLEDPWRRACLRLVETVDTLLPSILGKRKADHFRRHIAPYLKDRYNSRHRETFSVELFQRLILDRVLELGWTTERFGKFDQRVGSAGRDSRKPERIGKKYQWIAYEEFHARISDNFGVAETNTLVTSDRDWEEGLWPVDFRDLDPSLLLKGTPKDGWGVNHINWWTPCRYEAWTSQPTTSEWLQSIADLPPPMKFLDLSAPDGKRWLMLEGYAHWRCDQVESLEDREVDKPEIHYIFRSYLVRREHLPSMMAWGREQNWINDRLPQPGHRYRQHLHEHYWSAHFDGALDDEWISELRHPTDLPHPIVETAGEYICEYNTYDCSLDSTVTISLPSRWLAEKMDLKMIGRRGDFTDPAGQLIAFDPSTRERGHGALLVRKDALRDLLEREDLALFWTLLAEKNVYPPERMQRWLGRLTILGIYSWDGDVLDGSFRTEFADGRT
jgi:hypothetical protein